MIFYNIICSSCQAPTEFPHGFCSHWVGGGDSLTVTHKGSHNLAPVVCAHPLQPLLADSTPSPLVSLISLKHLYFMDFVPSVPFTWNSLPQKLYVLLPSTTPILFRSLLKYHFTKEVFSSFLPKIATPIITLYCLTLFYFLHKH